MAITCPKCGAEYDVTLFEFERGIICDCGQWVDLAVGHRQADDGSKQALTTGKMSSSTDQRRKEEVKLLAAIKDALPKLQELWEQANSHGGYEDPIYRFYHQSFKVYALQDQTADIVKALHNLAPHLPLNPWFTQIVEEGASEQFSMEFNQRWVEATRPIVEAFFHARYFLEMVCNYGKELEEPPDLLPSGWAAVLYLYGLR